MSKNIQELLASTRQLIQKSEETGRKLQRLNEESDREWKIMQRGGELPPKKPVGQGEKKRDVKELLASTRASIARYNEISQRQEELLKEMENTPLEQQCDQVYEEVGRKLANLEEADMRAAEEMDAVFDEDEQSFARDEELQRQGKPPPMARRS